LPDVVDVLCIGPQPQQQPVVLVANDNVVTLTMESINPVLYRQQYSQLKAAEFWNSKN
jgi:hypothetical protein